MLFQIILVRVMIIFQHALCEKYPYSEFFWPAFSRMQSEYGEIRNIYPFSVQMQENGDENNSEYGHFLSSYYSILESKKCVIKVNCSWGGLFYNTLCSVFVLVD